MDKIPDWVKDSPFPCWKWLLYGYVAELGLIAVNDSWLKGMLSNQSRGYLYVGIAAGWTIIWLILRCTLPHPARGRIGIVLCIDTDGSPDEAKMRHDFCSRLHKDIEESGLGETLQVLDPNPALCQAAIRVLSATRARLLASAGQTPDSRSKDSRGWSWLKKGTRAHFFIWGTVRKRQDGDKQRLYLQVDAIVTHAPLKPERQRALAAEFGSVWPARFAIDAEHAMLEAELTADWIASTSEYLIGVAALASGDPATALALHTKVTTRPISTSAPVPRAMNVMLEHARDCVAQEAFLLAWQAWRHNDANTALSLLDQALSVQPNSVPALSLRSIIEWAFLHDAEKAIQTTLKAKKYSANSDATWRYNLAFLFLERGQYEKSLTEYKKIMAKPFDGEAETLRQVIEFLEDCINRQPEIVTRHFALALILFKKSGDLNAALTHFDLFIEVATEDRRLSFLLERALSYRNEVVQKLESSRRQSQRTPE